MPSAPKPPIAADPSAAQILAEHYQKTNELTYSLREQRDKIFIFLLLALAVATLFNVDANSSNSLLIAGVVKFLEIKDPSFPQALNASPILEIIQTILLAIVFYLMGNLYQRTASVLRNYQYLGLMEQEIRNRLGIQDPEISFSREGKYYWRMRKKEIGESPGMLFRWRKRLGALNLTKNFYVIFLASLLFLSFALRIMSDIQTRNWILGIIDSLIAVPTVVYLYSYAAVSNEFDMPAAETKREKN